MHLNNVSDVINSVSSCHFLVSLQKIAVDSLCRIPTGVCNELREEDHSSRTSPLILCLRRSIWASPGITVCVSIDLLMFESPI